MSDTTQSETITVSLTTGSDMVTVSMDTLIDVYLDGVTTGVASAALYLHQEGGDAFADQLSDHMVDAMKTDPVGVREVHKAVTARINGTDYGPHDYVVYPGGDRS